MKVLFATTNPAKVKKYAEKLEKKGITLITIKDLDFKLEVDESGKNAIDIWNGNIWWEKCKRI